MAMKIGEYYFPKRQPATIAGQRVTPLTHRVVEALIQELQLNGRRIDKTLHRGLLVTAQRALDRE